MQIPVVVAISTLAVAIVVVALAIMYGRMLPAQPWARSVLVSLGAAATGVVAWLAVSPLLAPPGPLYVPIGLLGGAAALLATIVVRSFGASAFVTLVFGFAWSALAFVPAALLSFGLIHPLGLHPIDHGGSLAVNVAAGAAALGVILAGGPSAPRLRTIVLPRGLGVVSVVALAVGWLAWLVGAESAVDGATPGILVNGIVGAIGGIAGWLVVQRILHQVTTLYAVAAGLVSGLVSVAAGAPLFTPVSAAVAGVMAGAAAAIFSLKRVASSRRQQWFVVGCHLVAGAFGVILLGILATDMGFLFTGQVGFVVDQILSSVLVAAYSTAVSFVLWLLLKRVRVKAT